MIDKPIENIEVEIKEVEMKLEKLTPISSVDIEAYEQALDFIFNEKDLLNVAITGAYGAGKSSVLETYKVNNPSLKFIHISLADFQETINSDESDLGKHITIEGDNALGVKSDTVLEGKIINQLIHQIKPKDIPQTHFKIKRNNSVKKMLIQTLFTILFLLSAYGTFFFGNWYSFVSDLPENFVKDTLKFSMDPITQLLGGLVFLLLLCYFLYNLINMANGKSILKKFSVRGMEIEVLEENKDSYFDKYLNEVLYIFENSGANCIVFEDIDRYDNNRIFTKLKEINYLVNKKLEHKKIRFLYLLRDEIFVSKDRTKFFDLIIPVVPVVDSSNSLDIFIENFEKSNIIDDFDRYFLQGIAIYIDDMRLLKNIYNEYFIYRKRLNKSKIKLDMNRLLSIIALKNVFPSEFSQLQLGQGFIASIMKNKDKIISDSINKLKEQIKIKKKEIKDIQEEGLKSIVELDAIFIEPKSDEFIKHINNRNFNNRLELIEYMKEHPNEFRRYSNINSAYHNTGFTELGKISDLLNSLESELEYKRRKKLILDKETDTANILKKEIYELEKEIIDISGKKLSQLINKNNIDQVIKSYDSNKQYEELTSSEYFPLIKYLIRNGYINESYYDYMSYFYEKSFKVNDKEYIRSVLDEKCNDFAYNIEEPFKVVEALSQAYFRKEETLNNALLDYLLLNWSEKSKLLIDQIVENKKMDFLWQFLILTDNKQKFVKEIFKSDSAIIKLLLLDSDKDIFDKDVLTIEVISTFDEEELEEANQLGVLTNYLSDVTDIYSKEGINVKLLVRNLTLLSVKVNKIKELWFNKEILEALYINNLYTISIENIVIWLKNQYKLDFVDETKLTSLIFSEQEQRLSKYIVDNIEEYMTLVLSKDIQILSDAENIIVFILNIPGLSNSSKVSFVNRQTQKIEDISNVNDKELWDNLIKHMRVIDSCENIINYFVYKEKKISDTLVDFINSSENDIQFSNDYIQKLFDETTSSDFFDAVILENRIGNDKYKMILMDYGLYYESFSFENIDLDKIKILIELSIITLNEKTIKFMRDEYFQIFDFYVSFSPDEYLTLIEDEEISDKEIYMVLESNLIHDRYKLKLLSFSNEPLSIANREVSNEIILFILENRLDEADLQFLIEKLDSFDVNIQHKITEIASENTKVIINQNITLKPEFVISMLKGYSFSRDTIQGLILLCLDSVKKDHAQMLFDLANEDKLLSIFDFKNPNLPKNNYYEKILHYFKEKGWITQYKDSTEKQDHFKIYTRVKRKKN